MIFPETTCGSLVIFVSVIVIFKGASEGALLNVIGELKRDVRTSKTGKSEGSYINNISSLSKALRRNIRK